MLNKFASVDINVLFGERMVTRVKRTTSGVLPALALAILGYMSSPAALDAQAGQRKQLLLAAADSIQEGSYQWAEKTLQSIVAGSSSDWEALSLLAVVAAAKGNDATVQELSVKLRSASAPQEILDFVASANLGFKEAAGLRVDFVTAVKAGDVRAARALIDTKFAPKQGAPIKGALCVLMGDRTCLEAAISASGQRAAWHAQLEQQLTAAERIAKAYYAALVTFAGATQTNTPSDSLRSAELLLHERCQSLERELQTECRQKLMARLASLAVELVSIAPLSRSGLEASLTMSLLTAPTQTVVAASERMQRATGAVEWPLWRQESVPWRGAFGLKEASVPMILRITRSEVSLRSRLGFDQALVPLTEGSAAEAVEWSIPRNELSAVKKALRQPVRWQGKYPRDLQSDGHSVEFATETAKFKAPYPVGLYHFNAVYGEIPTRQVLRSLAQSLGTALELRQEQVEMVDSIQKMSRMAMLGMVAVAVHSVAMYKVGTGPGMLEQIPIIASSEEQRMKAEASQGAQWVQATQTNDFLQRSFDLQTGQKWVLALLDRLPATKGR